MPLPLLASSKQHHVANMHKMGKNQNTIVVMVVMGMKYNQCKV